MWPYITASIYFVSDLSITPVHTRTMEQSAIEAAVMWMQNLWTWSIDSTNNSAKGLCGNSCLVFPKDFLVMAGSVSSSIYARNVHRGRNTTVIHSSPNRDSTTPDAKL